jgi:hypothetical protein
MITSNSNTYSSTVIPGASQLPEIEATHPLSDMAQAYKSSLESLESANVAVREDKKGRSIMAKVYDLIAKTPAEKAFNAAKENHELISAEALSTINAWVDNGVVDTLRSSDPDKAEEWLALADKLVTVGNISYQSDLAVKLGDFTMYSIRAAISSINSAIGGEVMDMLTKNRGVSYLSSEGTAQAKTKVGEALKNASLFVRYYNNNLVIEDINISGTLDFGMNMIGLDSSSIYSAFDAISLDTARVKLRSLEEQLEGPFQAAQSAASKMAAEAQNIQGHMRLIDGSVRKALEASIPEPLQALIDDQRPINHELFASVKSVAEIERERDLADKNNRNHRSPSLG